MSPIRRPLRGCPTARRRRTLASCAVIAVLLGGSAFAATPATAATPPAKGTAPGTASASATPVKATAEEEDGPALSVTLSGDGLVGEGDALTATVVIDNPGDAAIAGGELVLRRGVSPLRDRDALDRWLGGSDGPVLTAIGDTETDEIAPGTDAAVELESAPITDDRGVYPVEVRLDAPTGRDLAARTVLIVTGGDEPDVTTVIPITAPATDRGLLTAGQLESLTAPDGALTALLSAADGTPAALAVDPAIPAAIRVLGAAAPRSAQEWLDQLIGMPNDRFALQFGDADVATQIAAGQDPLLTPSSLVPYLDESADDEAEKPSPSPSPTPTDGAPDPSELDPDELLDIGDDVPGLYWPDPAVVSGDVVSALAANEGRTLVPSTMTSDGADGEAVPANAEGLLVYDAPASAAFTEAASIADSRARSRALAEATASLWLASGEADGAQLLVVLDRAGGIDVRDDDRDTAPSPRPENAVAEVVSTLAGMTPRPLSTLLAKDGVTVTVRDGDDPMRSDVIDELHDAEERLAELDSMLSDPNLLTGRVRAEELQLLSVAWAAHPEAWDEAIAGHRESLTGLEDAVGLVPPSDVRLLSSEAPLPVWIRNDLPYPVTVTLFSRSDDVRLNISDVTEVEAQPSSNTRVQLPVEASLGSGDVTIELALETPDGVAVGDAQTMRVTVRADWERYGIAALAALIVLLVVAGTIRTIRRRRRRAGPDEEVTPDEPR